MDNKQIVRRALEEPWRDLSVLDELIDDSYVGYDPSAPEPIRGVQGVKDFVNQYVSAFENAQITVVDQIAEGDYVATRWEGKGRHTGELLGIAPTNREATVSGQTLSRLANGKIVEEWTNWDTLGMLQQIGAIPSMETAQAG
ncbi:MAG TPA: ester cyclase [Gaiellaceae bacterium]|jgi:predicted ester cyclase|nr:ester cyclase [Gaiellaceae bacterium]